MAKGNPRDPKRERRWRRHLERQAASGLSIRDYCAKHGLHEAAFYFWRREIAQRDAEAPAFVPVTLAAAAAAEPPIDIRLANGQRLRVRPGCDTTLLAAVIAALEGRPC